MGGVKRRAPRCAWPRGAGQQAGRRGRGAGTPPQQDWGGGLERPPSTPRTCAGFAAIFLFSASSACRREACRSCSRQRGAWTDDEFSAGAWYLSRGSCGDLQAQGRARQRWKGNFHNRQSGGSNMAASLFSHCRALKNEEATRSSVRRRASPRPSSTPELPSWCGTFAYLLPMPRARFVLGHLASITAPHPPTPPHPRRPSRPHPHPAHPSPAQPTGVHGQWYEWSRRATHGGGPEQAGRAALSELHVTASRPTCIQSSRVARGPAHEA